MPKIEITGTSYGLMIQVKWENKINPVNQYLLCKMLSRLHQVETEIAIVNDSVLCQSFCFDFGSATCTCKLGEV